MGYDRDLNAVEEFEGSKYVCTCPHLARKYDVPLSYGKLSAECSEPTYHTLLVQYHSESYLIIVFVRTCSVCLYSATSNALLVYSGDEGTVCCCVRITSGCCLTVCWANQIAGIALAGAGLCSAQYCCCIHSYFDFCSNCGAYN